MSSEKEPKIDQDGKMINPHNPEFITKVPWYLGNSGPTLKHHAVQKSDHLLSLTEADSLVQRKIQAQASALSTAPRGFRKGACKNCGATTHKEKDCIERPRSAKTSAWKTGENIAADDVSLRLEDYGKVSYDAKRDQWKGYDTEEYQAVFDKHDRLEAERHKQREEAKEKMREMKLNAKEKKKAEKAEAGEDKDSHSGSDSDSDFASDDEDERGDQDGEDFFERDESARDFQGTMAPQGGIGGNGMRQTVRNLRIREDTPKYLRNLALDSAFYDPKSRAMRANPFPNENPEDLPFAGDNFVRYSGDAVKLAQNQVLCWEMQARGEGIDVISNPSAAELVQREFADKKKKLEETKRAAVLAKYTDGNTNKTLDPRLRLGQTESYLEYSRDGKLLNAPQAVVYRTKYEEDVFANNHTSVWGSFYSRARAAWGYRCCHSCMKNSYCTGIKGREANDSAEVQVIAPARKPLEAVPAGNNAAKKSVLVSRSEVYGESSLGTGSGGLSSDRLQQAMEKNESNKVEDGKRGYNSMQSVDVTLEDMEAYRRKKVKTEDPMANLLDSDELLEYKK